MVPRSTWADRLRVFNRLGYGVHTFIPRQESDHSCHDSCPSTLRLFAAHDGGIARIRKPGSLFTPAELRFLGDAAVHYGDGFLYLSDRSHPQLRGVRKATGINALSLTLQKLGCSRAQAMTVCAPSSSPHSPMREAHPLTP